MGSFDRAARDRAAENLFLVLLDDFNRKGDNMCAKQSARNYAPTVFAKDKQAKQAGIRKADFEAAMGRLFEADKIGIESYGPPSRGTAMLVRK